MLRKNILGNFDQVHLELGVSKNKVSEVETIFDFEQALQLLREKLLALVVEEDPVVSGEGD